MGFAAARLAGVATVTLLSLVLLVPAAQAAAHKKHRVVAPVVVAPVDEARTAMDAHLPQNAGLAPVPAVIISDSAVLQRGTVEVLLGLGDHDPQWQLSQTALQVLPRRLGEISGKTALPPQAEDTLLTSAPNTDKTYRGLRLILTRSDGQRYAPLLIAQGKVMAPGGVLMAADAGRRLEYWLFGTARIRRDLLLASQVLPVVTFEECRVLGNSVVETTPRQCLLPDQNILLETSDPLTRSGLQAHDYDTCLRHGEALIYTFPRRCLAAGGRVFTEPPRVDAGSEVSGDLLTGGVDNPLNLPKPMGTTVPEAAGMSNVSGTPVGGLGMVHLNASGSVVIVTPTLPKNASATAAGLKVPVGTPLAKPASGTVPGLPFKGGLHMASPTNASASPTVPFAGTPLGGAPMGVSPANPQGNLSAPLLLKPTPAASSTSRF